MSELEEETEKGKEGGEDKGEGKGSGNMFMDENGNPKPETGLAALLALAAGYYMFNY